MGMRTKPLAAIRSVFALMPLLALGCGGADDSTTPTQSGDPAVNVQLAPGETQTAASFDYLLKISGVDGESKPKPPATPTMVFTPCTPTPSGCK